MIQLPAFTIAIQLKQFLTGISLITLMALFMKAISHWLKSHLAPSTGASAPTPHKQLIVDLSSIYTLLHPQPTPPLSRLLESRARPNARLIEAFNIDNAFTTTDPRVHSEFRQSVLELIRSIEKDYSGVSEVVAASIRKRMLLGGGPDRLHLAQFWRCVTMETILTIMFPESFSPEAVCEDDLEFVTVAINDIWNASKVGAVDLTVANKLHDILAKWTSTKSEVDLPSSPRHNNPLNLILPAYETLWRTALQTQINIMDSAPLMDSFRDFARCPKTLLFQSTNGGLSVEKAIAETLRVTPPTKRIYRSVSVCTPRRFVRAISWLFSGTPNPKFDTLGINVEAIQTDTLVWGKDAHMWNPQRQSNITAEQKKSTMPFGVGRLKCVAENVAPRLVGILVGRAVDEFDGWVLERGEEVGGRTEWKGWSLYRG